MGLATGFIVTNFVPLHSNHFYARRFHRRPEFRLFAVFSLSKSMSFRVSLACASYRSEAKSRDMPVVWLSLKPVRGFFKR